MNHDERCMMPEFYARTWRLPTSLLPNGIRRKARYQSGSSARRWSQGELHAASGVGRKRNRISAWPKINAAVAFDC